MGRVATAANQSRDGGSRRLLALAEIHDGRRRSDAARLARVVLRIVRDRVLRFDAEVPAGLLDRKAPGPAGPAHETAHVLGRSAPPWARPPGWSCPGPTPMRWACTRPRSAGPSTPAHTPW